MNYRREGTGPFLVCLHAIAHDAADFGALSAALRDRYTVISVDWPGHGASAPDTVPASATRYAALLADLLDTLHIDQAVLLGNSIGGAAALRYTLTHPTRVRALVLEDPGGLDPPDRLARVVTRAFAAFFAAGARGAWWFPRAFAAYYRLVLRTPAARARRAQIVAAARTSAPVLAEAWRTFGTAAEDLRARIPEIHCPVLFAWARGDRIIQLRRNRPAIRRFATAELAVFPGGHAAHLEAPEAFTARLTQFLIALQ